MCMKYVNSVTTCYSSMNTSNDNIISFNMPVNGVSVANTECPSIDKLVLLTQFNFLGKNKKFSVLDNEDCIDIIIRLTKCSKEPDLRLGCNLDEFSIDFAEIKRKNEQQTACFDFYDYMRITMVEDFKLPYGVGKYVIKVLIKKKNDSNFTIQSMTNLSVN